MDAGSCPSRRRGGPRGAAHARHRRHGRAVGGVDGDDVPRERALCRPGRAAARRHRSGARRGALRRPERVDAALAQRSVAMNLNFEGKSVVVTGGGCSIRRAIALAFARERASVTIAEIDEAQGKKVAAEAEQLGAKAQVVRTDVTKWSDVQAMVRLVEERFGRVDVLVNNVGWTRDALFIEKTRDEWEKEVQINLWSMINCTRAVLDGMIARKGGAIVSMGSDAGRIGEFREGVYGACKAGVIALSKSIAREVGKFGVRLNVVCPGMTMPANDEEIGGLPMWQVPEEHPWMTAQLPARTAQDHPPRGPARPPDVTPPLRFLASLPATLLTAPKPLFARGFL